MASFFNSPKTQLIGTALLSGAVVAGGIFGYQAVRRQERVEDLKSSIPQLGKEEYENAKVRPLSLAFEVEGEVNLRV
jgi:hypothetical protein